MEISDLVIGREYKFKYTRTTPKPELANPVKITASKRFFNKVRAQAVLGNRNGRLDTAFELALADTADLRKLTGAIDKLEAVRLFGAKKCAKQRKLEAARQVIKDERKADKPKRKKRKNSKKKATDLLFRNYKPEGIELDEAKGYVDAVLVKKDVTTNGRPITIWLTGGITTVEGDKVYDLTARDQNKIELVG